MSAADTTRSARPAYRPSWIQLRANSMLASALRRGRGPSFMRLLTVCGRVTGRALTTPVVPVRDGDRTWVVSPFGEVGWVRNARSVGHMALQRGDEHDTYTVRELDTGEAVPVLRAYLRSPARFFVRRHVAVSARSTDDAMAAEAVDHPVFELVPVR